MSAQPLNLNGAALGSAAAAILPRADIDQSEVDRARRRLLALAETALALAQAQPRHDDADALSRTLSASLDDATRVAVTARDLLDTSMYRPANPYVPLHHLRCVPLEVLSLIFEECLAESITGPFAYLSITELLSRQLQPFRLASVCRQWRYAALSSPRAWSYIDLNLDFVTRRNAGSWSACVSTKIARSAQAPLHIRLARTRRRSSLDGPLIQTLTVGLARCSSLLLDVENVSANDALLAVMQADFPVLRDLELCAAKVNHRVDRTFFFRQIPLLSHLQASFPFTGTQFSVPTLLTAMLQYCAVNDISSFLAVAGSLRNLRISYLQPVKDAIPPTSWPSVRMLAIRAEGHRGDAVGSLGEYLHFPGVEHLSLSGPTLGGRDCMKYFVAAAGAMPLLTGLSLMDHDLDTDGALFLQALPSCPALTSISFFDMELKRKGLREFCNFLSRPSDGTWPCPRLTKVCMSTCTFTSDCAQDDIVAFVEARVSAAHDMSDTHTSRPAFLAAVYLPNTADATVTSRLRALLSTME
ncbi:hypothetical protein EXIGLDRAFT_838674 [Exidia glandulosa HHB12029]|uniref:F-box domain-containing protein n=1 Tax=Exidia glandulosa HHB12029 TaxID=1314781 RepID=A0A165FLN0_EXIGL|nr:hypothetical protein EXIGLDRAFT_838674 [Exidia glandulosa HHB12029]